LSIKLEEFLLIVEPGAMGKEPDSGMGSLMQTPDGADGMYPMVFSITHFEKLSENLQIGNKQ
jgi:hypothetical protein